MVDIDKFTEDMDLKKLCQELLNSKFDLNDDQPTEPVWRGKLNGKGVMTDQSLVVLSGPSKGKKTLLLGSFKAAYLSDKGQHQGWWTDIDGSMICIDTEQTDEEHYIIENRVYEMADQKDNNPDYFSLKMRGLSFIERYAATKELLELHFKNPGILILDGIADYVEDTNDLKESIRLVTILMKWCQEKNIPIVVVIHTNNEGHPTGHLGKILIRKCSYHIMNTFNDLEDVVVTAKDTRLGQKFEDFILEHDENSHAHMRKIVSNLGHDEEIDESFSDDFVKEKPNLIPMSEVPVMDLKNNSADLFEKRYEDAMKEDTPVVKAEVIKKPKIKRSNESFKRRLKA